METNAIHIEAKDCMPMMSNGEKPSSDVMETFISTQINNIFSFASDKKQDSDSYLADYNYREKKWYAGRYVGEAIFTHNEQTYKVTIKPRFGEQVLFRFLEEIFNLKISKSQSENINHNDWQHFIKNIITFIWVHKLAKANLHGLPKIKIEKSYQGAKIRGRLAVRSSILPYYQNEEVISKYQEKIPNQIIANIIYQAYCILKNDFRIDNINIPNSAQDALNQISLVANSKFISNQDYSNIQYNEIYLSWKPIVDFSWDIIKRRRLSLKQNETKNGYGFFIDMAEIWEQYLRSILKRKLIHNGWHLIDTKLTAYKGYFFSRQLIPDLIFQKEDEICIWDAKYKRMYGKHWDIDRSDFFQIHTYIQHFIKHKEVKTGGLLFPISVANFSTEKFRSPFLLHENGYNTCFMIDGIELDETANNFDFQTKENDFINRIISTLS
ncbi:MAG: McrC family protein [Flavobacterium sp.]|jgi:5-methylcytosine-specific restriction endonuclease McrBC regulatory subunit McrC|nr:McrC family protein [Flavobacterium sp.]